MRLKLFIHPKLSHGRDQVLQKGVQCAEIWGEILSVFYVNIDPSLNEPLKAKVTDFLMEKEVLVGKYRGLQLPDEGDG